MPAPVRHFLLRHTLALLVLLDLTLWVAFVLYQWLAVDFRAAWALGALLSLLLTLRCMPLIDRLLAAGREAESGHFLGGTIP